MSAEKSFEELNNDNREKIILDVRSQEEYNRDTYPGAFNIPLEEMEQHESELPKDKPIYLMCYTGRNSIDTAELYQHLGYEMYSLEGGYNTYLSIKLKELMDTDALAQRTKDVERSIIKTFRKDVWCRFTKAINEYELIKDGDRIAVCISGGKDSMLMAKLFQELRRHGKHNFEVEYLVMDPGYNDANYQRIVDNASLLGIPINVFKSDIFDTVDEIGNNPCYMCARMRRGHLYARAKELGCNKIALGHHFDDVIETILMGMLYGGQMQSMMPKLHSTNFEGMELIRPLYLIREKDIIRWRDYNKLYFINCACRLTESCASCGGTEQGSKRGEIKRLIANLEKDNPFVANNIFRSAENVNIDTLIEYKQKGVRHNFLEGYDE